MSYFDDASLVMIPSGYKTSKVYSVKPTDGTGDLAFTRSNDTATRVGPDGLIEKVRTNRATYSQLFSNAAWTKGNVTLTASQADPNGGTSAFLVTDDATNDLHYFYQVVTPQAGEFTFSFYAKANTLTHCGIRLYDGTIYDSAIFNLSNGTKGSGDGSIESVGNGWYRVSLTKTLTAVGAYFNVLLSNGSSFVYSGSSQSIYVFGTQYESGVITDYIATTAAVSVGPVANVPRLDYLGSSCPRLLLEPQRSNLALYSEQFDNAVWTKVQITTTANSSVSPDGYANADKIAINNGISGGYAYQSIATTSSTVYTSSFFIKAAGINFTKFYSNVTGSYVTAVINLTTGAITNSGFAVTPTATNYGNGWWRVSYTETSGGGSVPIYVEAGSTSNGGAITGNGTDGILIWGAQVEAGAYATSYIPTLGAAVTRGVDYPKSASIPSLFGATEGTFLIEMTFDNKNSNGAIPLFLQSGSNSAYNYATYIQSGSSSVQLNVFNNGSQQLYLSGGNYTNGQTIKVAVAYKANDLAFYINGTQIGTGTPVSISSNLSFVQLGRYEDAADYFQYNGKISQLLLVKTRLTNAQLAELTTI